MNCHRPAFIRSALAFLLLVAAAHAADSPLPDPLAEGIAQSTGGQQVLKLPLKVVDSAGKPVAGAKVTPWALRSSQGHGWWRAGDERAKLDPVEVMTKTDGTATVHYPLYRDVPEQIRTLSVSVFIDHPEFAYKEDLHIDVPLESRDPYEIKLEPGIAVDVQPTIDGKPAALDNLFAFWSDGRSWKPGSAPTKTADGKLRFPALRPGKNSVLLVTLDGDRATHFSKITDFELKQGEPAKLDIPLLPARQIHGKLSDNVPRPVQAGRLKVHTLAPKDVAGERVSWVSWVAVKPDGTFTIDGWPEGESVQLIALCDGYIATSGNPPSDYERPYDAKKDGFTRPQIFDAPATASTIEVQMTPLVHCTATAVDGDEKPIAGITVASWPNVGWWRYGSQIYCAKLLRGERLLRNREYFTAIDNDFPEPFQGQTDSHGQVSLELPAGSESLAIDSEIYELPAFLGSRDLKAHDLTVGQTKHVTLHLQDKGTEKLGEWDKLAGVVFGCSTREGRRICALPEVRKKMDEFTERFREGKNQLNPQTLSEAYTLVADAFAGVGDQEESARWRKKASEEAAKAAK